MTQTRTVICPNGHKPDTDTPFYYPPHCIDVDDVELGVLAYADTSLSNRWQDGTAGIPPYIAENVHSDFCMPLCVECSEEAEWEQ